MLGVRSDRLATGGLVVLVGVLLLLSTTDALPAESLWEFLPAAFVALGLWALVRSGFRNLTGPVMVIAIAGTYQAKALGYVTDEHLGTWWPLFVVLFGVLLLLGRNRRARSSDATTTSDAGNVSLVSLFSGTHRRVTGSGFRGGDILVAFGGAELDLRDAQAPEETANVECIAAFGGAELNVPDDWRVELEVLNVFGGSEDKRPRRAGEDHGDPHLVVTGLAVFGGVTVSP